MKLSLSETDKAYLAAVIDQAVWTIGVSKRKNRNGDLTENVKFNIQIVLEGGCNKTSNIFYIASLFNLKVLNGIKVVKPPYRHTSFRINFCGKERLENLLGIVGKYLKFRVEECRIFLELLNTFNSKSHGKPMPEYVIVTRNKLAAEFREISGKKRINTTDLFENRLSQKNGTSIGNKCQNLVKL